MMSRERSNEKIARSVASLDSLEFLETKVDESVSSVCRSYLKPCTSRLSLMARALLVPTPPSLAFVSYAILSTVLIARVCRSRGAALSPFPSFIYSLRFFLPGAPCPPRLLEHRRLTSKSASRDTKGEKEPESNRFLNGLRNYFLPYRETE